MEKQEVNINLMENSKMKTITVIFFIVSASLFLLGCNNSNPNQQHHDIVQSNEIPLSHAYCDNLDTVLTYPDEVTHLYIRDLDTDSLPINFVQMIRLETVTITRCEKLNFAALFENMSKNNTIVKLDISECNIGRLPSEIGKINSLKILLLGNNNLKEISTMDKNSLKNIKEIDFSLNAFTEFPESICDLVSLESLTFDDNKIEKITNNINKLVNLKEIGIGGNPISERAAKKIKMEKNYGEEMERIMKLIPRCQVNIYRTPVSMK